MSLSQATKLLPTPVAQAPGNSAEAHLRKKPGRTQVTDLCIIAREPEGTSCPPRRPPTPPTHPTATGLTSTRQQEPYATVSAPTSLPSPAGKPSPGAQPQPRQNRPYVREANRACLSASSNGSWAYPTVTSRAWASHVRRHCAPSATGSSPCKQPEASCEPFSKNAKSPSRRAGQNTPNQPTKGTEEHERCSIHPHT